MTKIPPAVERLQRDIPEIRTVLNEGVRAWRKATGGEEPTGDYIFGSLLAPFTAELFRTNETRTETARKIFSFLEQRLAGASEWERNLVEVSFCEQFSEERDILQRAIEEMGPRLRRCIEICGIQG